MMRWPDVAPVISFGRSDEWDGLEFARLYARAVERERTMSENEKIRDLREALRLIDKHNSGSSILLNMASQLAEYIRICKQQSKERP